MTIFSTSRSYLLAVVVIAGLLGALALNPGHPWGDDWAGYLLQGKALREGTAAAEVAINAKSMQGSDVVIGPNAYPWGFPAFLAVTGALFGWELQTLKLVGTLSLVVAAVATYLLARHFFSASASALLAVLAILRPSVVIESAFLGSDVPFLALSTLGLAAIMKFTAPPMRDRPFPTWAAPTAGLLSVAAFTVRSNGAVLPLTFLVSVALLIWARHARLTDAGRQTVTYFMVFIAGSAAYFGLLPDGNISLVSMLSWDPLVWIERCITHVNHIASFITLDLISGPIKLVPLLLLLGLSIAGLIARPVEGAILSAYVACHLGLLTLFPYDGGARYYYPLLPPVLILFALGARHVRTKLTSALPGPKRAPGVTHNRSASVLTLVVSVALLGGMTVSESRNYERIPPNAPFGPETKTAFDFVDRNATHDAKIGFFKPRAFRLMTGRSAVAIDDPIHLRNVDWYIFVDDSQAESTQVDERTLRDPQSGFFPALKLGSIRVYRRGDPP